MGTWPMETRVKVVAALTEGVTCGKRLDHGHPEPICSGCAALRRVAGKTGRPIVRCTGCAGLFIGQAGDETPRCMNCAATEPPADDWPPACSQEALAVGYELMAELVRAAGGSRAQRLYHQLAVATEAAYRASLAEFFAADRIDAAVAAVRHAAGCV